MATPLKYFKDHNGWVESVAFSPEGKLLASASDDKTIVLRRLDIFDYSVLTGHAYGVYTVAFNPDGSMLASGSIDKTVRIWDIRPGMDFKVIRVLDAHREKVSCVAFHPDGNILASADFDQVVKIWDVVSWQQKSEFHACEKTWPMGGPGMLSIAFSPNGEKLAMGGVDWPAGGTTGVFRVVNQKTGITIWTSNPQQFAPILGLSFSPNGKLIAVADQNTLNLLDAESYATKVSLRGHRDYVNTIDFSPDGRVLASGSGDRQVIIWDLSTAPPRKIDALTHEGYVMTVKFSPDSRKIAVGDSNNTVTLWDILSASSPQPMKSSSYSSIDFHGSAITKTMSAPLEPEKSLPKRWWQIWK